MTVKIPEGIDWAIWRVATHERNRASLAEIQELWSLEDLIEAHLALDVHDELARKIAIMERRQAHGRK